MGNRWLALLLKERGMQIWIISKCLGLIIWNFDTNVNLEYFGISAENYLSVAHQCIQGNFPEANRILTDLEPVAKSYANFTLCFYLISATHNSNVFQAMFATSYICLLFDYTFFIKLRVALFCQSSLWIPDKQM